MADICIFAGTREGRLLTEKLSGRGLEMTVCAATAYGGKLLGQHEDVKVLTGGLNEEEMELLFSENHFDLVVDATHPYADLATENIQAAAKKTGIPCIRLLRSKEASACDGLFFPDALSCAQYLEKQEGNVFLTTGSKDLPVYTENPDLRSRVFARVLPMMKSLEICEKCLLPPEHVIAMQGPFDESINTAMMKSVRARFMVTKDTGDAGGYGEKIAAARKLGVQVLVIGRPMEETGLSLDETEAYLTKKFHLTPLHRDVFLCGIGMGDRQSRTVALEEHLQKAELLIGAKRMLDSVDTTGRKTVIAIRPEDIMKAVLSGCQQHIAVLFSGDTGFYSGTKKLAELLEKEENISFEVLPAVGSLSYFSAKIHVSWEDARLISLHGRSCNFLQEIRENKKVFALVGGSDGVKNVLTALNRPDFPDVLVYVGEKLGYADEKITAGSAEQLLKKNFDPLSVMMILNPAGGKNPVVQGLPDQYFERTEVPMTKEEVRAVVLSKLQLCRDSVVYDIGCGTGSVTVEMARMAGMGQVYAMDMKEEAVRLTQRNADRFGLLNVHASLSKAPEGMEDWPAPTHAFIGGSGGNLKEIIGVLLKKNPDVRIVVTAVTMETLAEITALLPEFSCTDTAEISVSKPRKLGHYHLMTAQNPVYVVTLQGALPPVPLQGC